MFLITTYKAFIQKYKAITHIFKNTAYSVYFLWPHGFSEISIEETSSASPLTGCLPFLVCDTPVQLLGCKRFSPFTTTSPVKLLGSKGCTLTNTNISRSFKVRTILSGGGTLQGMMGHRRVVPDISFTY